MMRKFFTTFLALATLNLSVWAATPLTRGTMLNIRTSQNITLNQGATAAAYVDADVKSADGKVLIKRGTPVVLDVKGQKARGCGRPGEIAVTCLSTTAVDGQTITLMGGQNAEGANKKGLALGLGIGLGLTFLPFVGFAFLAIKGGAGVIPQGMLIPNVMVQSDYTIQP